MQSMQNQHAAAIDALSQRNRADSERAVQDLHAAKDQELLQVRKILDDNEKTTSRVQIQLNEQIHKANAILRSCICGAANADGNLEKINVSVQLVE